METHVSQNNVYNRFRFEHRVHILSFIPPFTLSLQPLDVVFTKPLSTYFAEASTNWMRVIVDEVIGKAANSSTAYNALESRHYVKSLMILSLQYLGWPSLATINEKLTNFTSPPPIRYQKEPIRHKPTILQSFLILSLRRLESKRSLI